MAGPMTIDHAMPRSRLPSLRTPDKTNPAGLSNSAVFPRISSISCLTLATPGKWRQSFAFVPGKPSAHFFPAYPLLSAHFFDPLTSPPISNPFRRVLLISCRRRKAPSFTSVASSKSTHRYSTRFGCGWGWDLLSFRDTW